MSDARAARPAWPINAWDVALGAFVLGLFVILQSFLPGPFNHADEGGYLVGAAALAGQIENVPVVLYHFGYSALLLPAFLLAPDVETFYRLALLTNGALVLGVFIAARHLGALLYPAAPRAHLALAAAVCALQPSVFPYGFVAMGDLALGFFAILFATALVQHDRSRGLRSIVVAAIAIGIG